MTFSLLLPFIQFISGCFSENASHMAIQFIRQYPVSSYKENGQLKVLYLLDTVDILYYTNYTLYKFGPVTQFETGNHIAGTEQFYLTRSNHSSGRLFASLRDTGIGTEMPVDSFNSQKIGRGIDFDIPPDTIWKKVTENKTENDEGIVEKYVLLKKQKDNSLVPDTIIYHFAPVLKGVDFSFSKKLDKEKGLKLFKVLFVQNGSSPADSGYFPLSAFQFELRDHQPPNSNELIGFIKSKMKYFN